MPTKTKTINCQLKIDDGLEVLEVLEAFETLEVLLFEVLETLEVFPLEFVGVTGFGTEVFGYDVTGLDDEFEEEMD